MSKSASEFQEKAMALLYWGWLVLRGQSVLPQQMVLSNPLIFYGLLKVLTLLMPDNAFRLAFTNGLMSESMVLWFGSILIWLYLHRNSKLLIEWINYEER